MLQCFHFDSLRGVSQCSNSYLLHRTEKVCFNVKSTFVFIGENRNNVKVGRYIYGVTSNTYVKIESHFNTTCKSDPNKYLPPLHVYLLFSIEVILLVRASPTVMNE